MIEPEPADATPQMLEAASPAGMGVGLTVGGEYVTVTFDVHNADDECRDISFALEPDAAEALAEMIRRVLVQRVANLQ